MSALPHTIFLERLNSNVDLTNINSHRQASKVVMVVRWYLDLQSSHCSMTGYLTIMGRLSYDGRIPTYFLWLEYNLPPSVILITLRLLVPGIWSVRQRNVHAMTQGKISYMRTCNYFLIQLQTSNYYSYRTNKGQTIKSQIN